MWWAVAWVVFNKEVCITGCFWNYDIFTFSEVAHSWGKEFLEAFKTTTCDLTDNLFFWQEVVEDEDDDFLKGEVGTTPGSFDTHFRSPSSSVGSPPVLYLPGQSPLMARICDWDDIPPRCALQCQGSRCLSVASHQSQVPASAAYFAVTPTLVSEQMWFLFVPVQTEGEDYHVQYFTVELMINVEGWGCLYFFCVTAFDIIIVKFLWSARAYFNTLHF